MKGLLVSTSLLVLAGLPRAAPLSAAIAESTPVWSWTFDEESADAFSAGSGSGTQTRHGNLRTSAGVRGKSLQFDGLTTFVSHRDVDMARLRNGFTVEAWVAHQTYSWAQTAIIDASQDEEAGFRLGTDDHGRLGLWVALDDHWVGCISTDAVPLLKWAHVAATFQQGVGLRVYLDGRLVGSRQASGAMTTRGDVELLVGRSHTLMEPANVVDELGLVTNMIFDGLIDEVNVYDRPFSAQEVQRRFAAETLSNPQPLRWRQMPTGPAGSGPFGAYYTRLRYSPAWDDAWRSGSAADILVRFDRSPTKLMFWRGTNYGAVWVTENGLLMGDQSLERAGAGKSPWGCCEHMSDKQCRYSSVRIVENNNARAIIHWRYAVSDVKYQIFGEDPISGWGEWAEEHYTIYPDGVSTRKQTLWSAHLSHEWQETIPLHQPGTRPEDNLADTALTLANMDGLTHSYSWVDGSPLGKTIPEDATIQLTNLRSKYRPFLILEPSATIKIKPGVDFQERGTHYQWWNHWPVAQAPSPGTKAVTYDRPSHSHLTQTIEDSPQPVILHDEQRNTFTAVHLIGMTDEPITRLVPLARSWNFPPQLDVVAGNFTSQGYDKYQRAYVLSANTPGRPGSLVVRIATSESSPLVNPALVINNWGADRAVVTLDGRRLEPGREVRVGSRRQLDGTDLIIWLPLESARSAEITVKPSDS